MLYILLNAKACNFNLENYIKKELMCYTGHLVFFQTVASKDLRLTKQISWMGMQRMHTQFWWGNFWKTATWKTEKETGVERDLRGMLSEANC